MIIDVIIVALGLSSLYRGRHIGFVRQACSTGLFFAGLFAGAWLQPYTVELVNGEALRGVVTAMTTLGLAIVGLSIGEYIGFHAKHRFVAKRINSLDEALGSLLALSTLLIGAWLLAALSASLSVNNLQNEVDNSRIISALNNTLPDAPTVIADLGQLIDPNGFPDVFAGVEPVPKTGVKLPELGDLQTAVTKSQASVVKIVGQGCGGLVDGSGFVARPGYVITNAHVVAGIRSPRVLDSNGTHQSTIVWFDANLDFAVLRVSGLAGRPLPLQTLVAQSGTPVAVLGFPGGGGFTAQPGAVLDQFRAAGRNIYGKASASRDVYELSANVKPGNSGGPMVNIDGAVIGLIFAESTTYENVGYALTAASISGGLDKAVSRNQTVGSGRCAE